MVVAAARRAARPVHRERSGVREPGRQALRELLAECFRLDERQVAVVLSGAAHEATRECGRRRREPGEEGLVEERLHVLFRHAHDDRVLAGREAYGPRAVDLGEPGEFHHVGGLRPAGGNAEPHRVEALLTLCGDAEVVRCVLHPHVPACGRERSSPSLLQPLPEELGAPLLHEEGEAGLRALLTGALVAEQQRDRCREPGRLFGCNEYVQRLGDGHAAGTHLAPDGDVEAVRGLRADGGSERDVLRLAVRAVFEAAGDGDVQLAREVGVLAVAEERLRELFADRRGVEQFVGRQAGEGAGIDAADVVHAGLQRGEVDAPQSFEDVGDVTYLDGPQFQLLPGGDVDNAVAEALRERGQRVELARGKLTVGDADPHHESSGGGLAEERAYPLQPLAVVRFERLPAAVLRGEFVYLVQDVESVLLVFDALDGVHAFPLRIAVEGHRDALGVRGSDGGGSPSEGALHRDALFGLAFRRETHHEHERGHTGHDGREVEQRLFG